MKFSRPLQESFPRFNDVDKKYVSEKSQQYVSRRTLGILPITGRCRALALEDRIPLLPPMHLMAGRTLDRVLLLDRQLFERLRIHRKARINQLARLWALYQYTVHGFPMSCRTDEPGAN
jgi:hypothetical protein